MSIAEIFGWGIYGIIALFCISGLIDIFTRGRSPRGNIGSSVLFLWVLGIVCIIVFAVTDINKLYMLWIMPTGVIIGWTRIGRVIGLIVGTILRVNVWDASQDISGAEMNKINWCDRHLNWTWVLAFLFVLGNLALWFAKDGVVGGLEVALLGLAVLIVSGWVIIQKGRSLWWLLLSDR